MDPADPAESADPEGSAGSDEAADSVGSASGVDLADPSASSAQADQADAVDPATGEVDEPLDQSGEASGSVTQPLGGQVDEPLSHSATEPVDGEDIEEGPVPLGDDEFDAALEALLLVVDSPADEESLADALDTTPLRVAEHLRLLSNKYADQDRGIDLRRAGGGWRFYTRDRYAPYVEKFLLDGQRAKLTRAALETLAVIAYRQPVTRARVAAVRGVNCDGVIRTLLARGLVEETGTDQETGGHLYRTTELFLERLGLSSLEDLPPIAPLLPEVDSIDEL
jgi:segregation and condensation protein B